MKLVISRFDRTVLDVVNSGFLFSDNLFVLNKEHYSKLVAPNICLVSFPLRRDSWQEIRTFAKQFDVDRVIALEESDILEAARIESELTQSNEPFRCACLYRDKFEMRQALALAGLPTPTFAMIDETKDVPTQLREFEHYPAMLKPRLGMSSQGLRYIAHDRDIDLSQLAKLGAPMMLEKFLDYPIYHVDGVVDHSRVGSVTVTKYINSSFLYLSGNPVGGIGLKERDVEFAALASEARKVVQALGDRWSGSFHAEFFWTGQQPVLVEIARRAAGGAGKRLLDQIVGESYEEHNLKQIIDANLLDNIPYNVGGHYVAMLASPAPLKSWSSSGTNFSSFAMEHGGNTILQEPISSVSGHASEVYLKANSRDDIEQVISELKISPC